MLSGSIRRLTLALIALLLSTPVFVFAADPKPTPIPKSEAIEFEFTHPGQEPIKVTNHYGYEKDVTQAAETAANIEKNGDGHVEFFVNEGEEYKLTPAIRKEFERYGVIVDPIVLPKTLQKQFTTVYEKVFEGVYKSPTTREWTVGILSGVVRSSITGMVWFAAPGVTPELAIQMTAVSGTLTMTHAVFGETVENFFWKGIKNKDSRLGKTMFFLKDFSYSMFLINMMNNIGGHAHLNPWQLNASMLAITAMGSLNGTVRRAALQSVQKTHLNVAYSIMVMPILYTLQGLESSGALPTLFKIGFYEVRPSIIAAFTIYSSLILTSAYRPQLMVNILQTVQEKTNPFLSWIEDGIARMRVRFFGGTQGYCKTMYKKEMKAAAGEQPPNATFEENL